CREGTGNGGRRWLLSQHGAGAAGARHPCRPVPPAAGEAPAPLHRAHGARPRPRRGGPGGAPAIDDDEDKLGAGKTGDFSRLAETNRPKLEEPAHSYLTAYAR